MSNPNTNMRDSQQNCVHGIPRFRDYDIRIWNDEDGNLVGTYINADFNTDNPDEPYNGIFYHMSDDHLSIEIGTHDEALIAKATHLCKEIVSNMQLLDELLNRLNNQ